MTVLELATRWAEPPRILVCEPDEEAAQMISAALLRYGCQPEIVTNVKEAETRVKTNEYALFLFSAALPGDEGQQLVTLAQQVAPETPLLVATLGTERWLIELLESRKASVFRPPLFQQTLRNTFAALGVTPTA